VPRRGGQPGRARGCDPARDELAANLAKYGADPVNLAYSAAARRNVHFLTFDSCHPASANATSPTTFVYSGTPRQATFNVGADPKSSQFAPVRGDDANRLFVWTKANAAAGSAAAPIPSVFLSRASNFCAGRRAELLPILLP
jgi:hypothetical protein